MKKAIFYIFLFFIVGLIGCSEEQRGQYPIHTTPPKPIKSVTVENLPGAVKISYELPDETDILYVQAQYQLADGKTYIQKTSVFNNSMLIKGFAKSIKTTILLSTVDRSQNVSEPIEVEIEPQDSPIYDIFNSLKVTESFGGVVINWDNPHQEEIMIGVLASDYISGEAILDENIYSTETSGKRAVRGMGTSMTTVAVFVRDIFMNYTDTLVVDVTPMFEEKIPKKGFSELPLPSFVRLYGSRSRIALIWDDNIFDEKGHNYLYFTPGNEHLPYFSFDMGVKAKLSRVKVWPRLSYAFTLHSPKIWEWWGTNDKVAAEIADDLNWQENPAWIKLMRSESKRPSGLEAGAPMTNEDREYIEAGEEFEFPAGLPAVRYLRFQLITSWSGSDGLNLQEIELWGNIQN